MYYAAFGRRILKGDAMKILTALITETTEILEKDKLQLLKMDMDGVTAADEADKAAEEDEYNEDYDAGPGEYDDFF